MRMEADELLSPDRDPAGDGLTVGSHAIAVDVSGATSIATWTRPGR